ncbi:MAG: hypothetical protein NVS3B5_09180 [Sphingomicrobium sp.]
MSQSPPGVSMNDEYSYWSRAKAKIWDAYRECPPFTEMAEAAAQSASEKGIPREQFEWQLNKLYEAYSSVLHGTNSDFDSSKWRHWHNRFGDARLGKKWGKPEIQAEMLSGAAYDYLNGALRVPRMDRALLDSLIAQETFAYIDRRAGRGKCASDAVRLFRFSSGGSVGLAAPVWNRELASISYRKCVRRRGLGHWAFSGRSGEPCCCTSPCETHTIFSPARLFPFPSFGDPLIGRAKRAWFGRPNYTRSSMTLKRERTV